MPTFSKIAFSPGGTQGNGLPILVTSVTAGAGNSIHSCSATSGVIDEVWIYAYNGNSATLVLTLQYGGVSVPLNDIKLNVPSQTGLTLVVPGLILRSTGTALAITAWASIASFITLSGYVNRIA